MNSRTADWLPRGARLPYPADETEVTMRVLKVLAVAGVLLLGAGFLSGCQRETASDGGEVEELRVEGATADTLLLPRAELQRAREAATALGQDLAGLVFTTLEAQGAPAAVRLCSEIAQERTAAHGGEGVSVRRVSNRLRNAHNEPDAAERRELERMQVLDADGRRAVEIVRLVPSNAERQLHLMRPIRIQPGCLACHGTPDEIDPEVSHILAERYPDDRAIGYTTGQLRGAVSVRVPLDATD
jgi:hypothetical protein